MDIDSIVTTFRVQVSKTGSSQTKTSTLALPNTKSYISHYIIDVDECVEGTDTCAQTCTNMDGSYTCPCDPGYRLASDNQQCDGKE